MSDLLALVLNLRPLESPSEARAIWFGRAAQALFLDAVERVAPSLANDLHEGSGLRPYTVSSLLGLAPDALPDPARTYFLRFTACRADVVVALQRILQDGIFAPGKTLDFEGFRFQVEAIHIGSDHSPLAGSSDYSTLMRQLLPGQAAPQRRLTLQLSSPTAFKRQERHIPLPLPDLVFGNLLERWNSWAPIALPEEVRRYAAECLTISRYRLQSVAVPLKEGGLRIGAIGSVTFNTLNYARYWMAALHMLAEFAFFSGVGVNTGQGMGQARAIS